MAKYESEFSDDEFDEEYFTRPYQPLSNLPTPPPSSRESLASQSPRSILEDGELLQSALLGPAIHLINLIPTSASLTTPSVSLVHEMLTRADIPLDTVALAVCIMDSLNSNKFSRNWRLVCPLARLESSNGYSKRHTLPAGHTLGNQLSIDYVHPEVIILASLMIAVKFLEDCQEPTQYYLSSWGQSMWTCEQVNATERCIMESLGYRILPLWKPELITDALRDMELAGKQASLFPQQRRSAIDGPSTTNDDQHKRSMSSGTAVFGLGLPLTPAETPRSENAPIYDFHAHEHGLVANQDTGAQATPAFAAGSLVTRDTLKLPLEVQRTGVASATGLGGMMHL